MRILLVDDEPDLLEELSRGLKRRDHSVVTAKNGQEAWEEYTDFPNIFDVVITDVKMPVMDGMELLEKIREYDSEARVIIMTGHGDLELSVQALNAGAFSYFVKPFDFKEFYTNIAKLESGQLSYEKQITYLSTFSKKIEFSIPSQVEMIPYAMLYMEKSFKWLCQLLEINSFHQQSCIGEAITNAVVRGNLEIPSSLKEGSQEYNELLEKQASNSNLVNRKVTIKGVFTEGRFECEIKDEGAGFDFEQLPDKGDTSNLLIDGKGLQKIRYYMDEVTWETPGNHIKMVKHSKKL